MRYFIWFSYDGTQYHGWQIQPNGVTVQSELQRCLSLLLREEVTVTGAGRTDTGVHARRMAAHFDTETTFDPQLLTHKLNGLLHTLVSRLLHAPTIITSIRARTLLSGTSRWNCTISWTTN